MSRRLTLPRAKQQWATRRRRYVVGYIGSGNVIFWDRYGKKPTLKHEAEYAASDPMTLREARALLANMPAAGAAIFELKPIVVGGGQR